MAHFTKHNYSAFADSLIREAEGLAWLRESLPSELVSVPEVVSVDEHSLVMTAIAARSGCPDRLARALGEGLARMHGIEQPYYGFEADNYIGLNPQCNTPGDSWGRFFVERRLRFQLALVSDTQLRSRWENRLAKAEDRLLAFLNESCEHPSLVHGDLWSGNYLCDGERVWLIDPAAHFADREVDLAMSEMFGGFPGKFYEGYDAIYPRRAEYPRKRPIYNLYHYLNHYNLFGGGYLGGCEAGFDAIESL